MTPDPLMTLVGSGVRGHAMCYYIVIIAFVYCVLYCVRELYSAIYFVIKLYSSVLSCVIVLK